MNNRNTFDKQEENLIVEIEETDEDCTVDDNIFEESSEEEFETEFFKGKPRKSFRQKLQDIAFALLICALWIGGSIIFTYWICK